jgi:hypothetical protein
MTEEKTQAQMDVRLSQLLQLRSSANLTLKTAGELDAIRNHGLVAWRQFCKKRYATKRMGWTS